MSFESKPVRPLTGIKLAQPDVIRKGLFNREVEKGDIEKVTGDRAESITSKPIPYALLQEPDRERIAVDFTITGPHGRKDHTNKPDDQDNGQNGEPNQDKAEKDAHGGVDRIRDLKVQHFLPRGVDLGAVCTLDQPDDEGSYDVHQRPSE